MRGGGTPLAFLFAALLIGGLVLLVVVGVRVLLSSAARPEPMETGDSPSPASRTSTSRSEARRILDERYARGELTTAEYRERVETLGEGP